MAAMDLKLFGVFLVTTFVFSLSSGRSALFPSSSSFHRFLKAKRLFDGNPCPDAEKPFPCKSTPTCIPMGYLCDDSVDCEDGYDEDPEVCTAAHRPPVEDILNFLESTKSWIMDKIFSGQDISQVAHGLVVSATVEDYRKRLGLTEDDMGNLRSALKAVSDGDEGAMTALGMPPSAWNESSFMFGKLIKSGFAA